MSSMENSLLPCILVACGQELVGNLCTASFKDASGPYDLKCRQAGSPSKSQNQNFRH